MSEKRWPRERYGIKTRPVMYYCIAHHRWEPLDEETLADSSLCDFCCFHKPYPLGHDDEYWEEGWDEFECEYGDDGRVSHREIYSRRMKEKEVETDDDELIIDYVDLTKG